MSAVVDIVVVVDVGGSGGVVSVLLVLVVVVIIAPFFLPARPVESVLHGWGGLGGWPLSPSFIPGSHHGPGRYLVVRLRVCVVASFGCPCGFWRFRWLKRFLRPLCVGRCWLLRGSVLFFGDLWASVGPVVRAGAVPTLGPSAWYCDQENVTCVSIRYLGIVGYVLLLVFRDIYCRLVNFLWHVLEESPSEFVVDDLLQASVF